MGKVLWTDGDQFDSNHPGCISGIFHVLHHQYWHSNVKKIIPHNTNHKGNRRYTSVSDDEDPFEIVKLLGPETNHILVDKSDKKNRSTQKRSLKARIKALVSEEQNQDVVSSPRLQRTYSVHHSESNDWVNPIIFFPENLNSESPSNVTNPENNDSQDILEMLEVDKDLFINILQESSQLSDTKPKLTKSGSFPSGRNLKPTTLKDKLNEFYKKSKSKKSDSSNSNNDFNNNSVHIKRASSLNESADRYARLFDFSVTNEAVLRTSRSLKLTNKSEIISNAHERNSVSFPLNLNPTQDFECLNEAVMDKSDNLSENKLSICPQEEEIQSDFHILEGLDLVCNSQENHEKETETIKINKQMKSKRQYKDDDDYTYVKQILERSGFIKNGFEQTWYSSNSNQPLNPFLFQEIESEYVHDPDNFEEELNELSHRLLIFELVDDILITMYERSLTYYPKSLSSLCHIHPAPSGSVLLGEVWKRVSQLVELKPDMTQSLDYIVSRDLGSDDGWMNLQLDSECVALDLEDLILDEVLDELLGCLNLHLI